MSKKIAPDLGTENTELPEQFEAEPQQAEPSPVAARKLVYTGPVYDKGIEVGGTRTMIRPAEFSDEQIEAFIHQYPNKASWWTLQ